MNLNSIYKETLIMRGLYDIEPLTELLHKHDLFIAGGFARWMCSPAQSPAPASDVDIYGVKSAKHFNEVARELSRSFEILDLKHDTMATLAPQMAFNSDTDLRWGNTPTLQLVNHPAYSPDSDAQMALSRLLSAFDLINVQAAVYFDKSSYTWKAWAHQDFGHFEQQKLLEFASMNHPLSSLKRVIKYAKRGYIVPDRVLMTILRYWSSLSDESRKVVLNHWHGWVSPTGETLVEHTSWHEDDDGYEGYSVWFEQYEAMHKTYSEIWQD